MRKTLLLSILILFFVPKNYSQILTSWSERSSGVTTQLTSVSVPGGFLAWVCGYSGVVLRTTNTGNNWVNVNTGGQIPLALNLHNIFALSSNTAFVSGNNGTGGYLFRTTNGGVNWTQVFFQPGGFINVVWMVSGNNGFIQGDPVGGRWSLWRSTNGGINWDSTGMYLQQTGTEAGWNNSFAASISSVYFFGTNNTRVYRSNNLTSWLPLQTTGLSNIYSIGFAIDMGLAGGDASLLKTTNNGLNWMQPTTALPGSGAIIGIVSMIVSQWRPFWVARSSNTIYFTLDGGDSWSTSYTAPNGSFTHLNNSQNVYAVRNNGGISVGLVLTSGINAISSNIPAKIKLYQNYPNPFNPVTKIRFDVSERKGVSLVLYDILGQEVIRIFEGQLNPGEYEITWNAVNLSSGIYYYRLLSGEFSEIKKLVLIK